jgi:hypothetical protein
MRTIVLGLAFVLGWYILLAALLTYWLGGAIAALTIVGCFVAAHVDFLLRDRMRRAWRRARTYLALRADPALRAAALAEIEGLIAEGLDLEAALASPRTTTTG